MRKFGLIFLLTITIFLSSCTSFRNSIQADLEGVPIWYIGIPTSKRSEYFVGRGNGSSIREAENNAHHDLLENVSEYLGQDIADQYYRQFTLNDSVVELDLIIERREERTNNDSYSVFYLASAPRETLDEYRSDSFKEIIKVEEEISLLLEDALQAYKDNKDILTIEKYLDAVHLALQYDVRDEYSANVLLEKASKYLDNIYLTVSRGNTETAEARVRARRDRGMIDPPIVDSEISAYFTLHDTLNSYVEVSNVYLTNNEGYIYFSPVNKTMTREGKVSFGINLDDSFFKIERVAPGFMTSFKEQLEQKRVDFEYNISSKISGDDLLVFIAEYDVEGNILPTTIIQDKVLSFAETESITASTASSAEEEDEFIIEDIQHRYPDKKYLLLGKAGEVETFDEGSEIYLLLEGHFSLVDLETGLKIAENTLTSVFSRGTTKEEAREAGFKRFGDVFISGFFNNL